MAASVLVAMFAAGALWLWSEPKPDTAAFLERRGRIAAVEMEAEIREPAGFLSQNVHLLGESGMRVDLTVLRPGGAEEPLPLFILVGGHRTGRDAVRLIGAPRGVVVAALDYPYDGPERPKGVAEVLRVILPARRALADMPAAVMLAADWLVEQPWADAGHVELAGVSLGVPFAAVAGGVDPRFRRVWLIHGGADLRGWIEHNIDFGPDSRALRSAKATVIHRLAMGSRFEPDYWVPRIAPRPVVIVAAREDKAIPVELVHRLHAAVTGPGELVWMDGGHINRSPGAIEEILGIVFDRMGAESRE
jgi:dienelactone hydrolase